MKMQLVKPSSSKRVSARDILDYDAFSKNHRQLDESNELRLFEKFYAARYLATEGFETYIDADVSESSKGPPIRVDAVGKRGDALTLVFCETGGTESPKQDTLDRIEDSDNANAVILMPKGSNLELLNRSRQNAHAGKISVEVLDWFADELDPTLQRTLRVIDLLGNETRMRMLAPLFRKTGEKKDYRTRINPKLVYQNLSAFLETGLVSETDEGGAYELSQVGKSIMADFIAFLEKTRRTLDSATRDREVKSIE